MKAEGRGLSLPSADMPNQPAQPRENLIHAPLVDQHRYGVEIDAEPGRALAEGGTVNHEYYSSGERHRANQRQ